MINSHGLRQLLTDCHECSLLADNRHPSTAGSDQGLYCRGRVEIDTLKCARRDETRRPQSEGVVGDVDSRLRVIRDCLRSVSYTHLTLPTILRV